MTKKADAGAGREFLRFAPEARPPDFTLNADNTLPDVVRSHPTFAARYDVPTWQLLGVGGYAYVGAIACNDEGDERAVKIFQRLIPEERHDRVRDERRNAQRVDHPCIVRIYTIFLTPTLHWIEMELVRGTTVKRLLEAAQGRPLPFGQAHAIALHLLDALRVAHEAVVVHRDIKPENLIVPAAGAPLKILDFGISKAGEAGSLTPTTFPGSPFYAAPECYRGGAAGPPADVYSAALVLYELFTGQYPFPLPEDPNICQLSDIHNRRTGIAPRDARYLVQGPFPLELDAVLKDALALDPDARPTAADFLAVLRRIDPDPSSWSIEARPHLVAGTSGPEWPRGGILQDEASAAEPRGEPRPATRRTGLLALGAALAVAGLAGVGLVVFRRHAPAPAADRPGAQPTSRPVAIAPEAARFQLTWLGEGNMALSSLLSGAAAVEILTTDGTHRCCNPGVEIGPGENVLVWAERWDPPLPAHPPPERLKVLGRVDGQLREDILDVAIGPDTP